MQNNKKLQNFTNTLSNLFLLCLGLLAFQSIFGQAIFGFEMAIVFGGLIFYVNREEVESVEEEKLFTKKIIG